MENFLLTLFLIGYLVWSFWRGVWPKRNTTHLASLFRKIKYFFKGEEWSIPIPLFWPIFNPGKFLFSYNIVNKDNKVEQVTKKVSEIPTIGRYPYDVPLKFISAGLLNLPSKWFAMLEIFNVDDFMKYYVDEENHPLAYLGGELREALGIWAPQQEQLWLEEAEDGSSEKQIRAIVLAKISGINSDKGNAIKINDIELKEYLNSKKPKGTVTFEKMGVRIIEFSPEIGSDKNSENLVKINNDIEVQKLLTEKEKEIGETTAQTARNKTKAENIQLKQDLKKWEKLGKDQMKTAAASEAEIRGGYGGKITTLINDGRESPIVAASIVSRTVHEGNKTSKAA